MFRICFDMTGMTCSVEGAMQSTGMRKLQSRSSEAFVCDWEAKLACRRTMHIANLAC